MTRAGRLWDQGTSCIVVAGTTGWRHTSAHGEEREREKGRGRWRADRGRDGEEKGLLQMGHGHIHTIYIVPNFRGAKFFVDWLRQILYGNSYRCLSLRIKSYGLELAENYID